MLSETERASLLIGQIYDAALDPSLWRAVLAGMCKFVPAGFGILITEDAVSERAHVHYTSHDEAEWLKYISGSDIQKLMELQGRMAIEDLEFLEKICQARIAKACAMLAANPQEIE